MRISLFQCVDVMVFDLLISCTLSLFNKHKNIVFSQIIASNMAYLTDRVESRKCLCEFSKNIDDPILLNMLPIEYKYALCERKEIDGNRFECKFRVNIRSKVEALQWFEEFNFSSNTAYTKAKTYPGDTQGNVFKTVWKCIHNTRPAHTVKMPHKKHTNCPARLIITVKQMLSSKGYQSKDIHLKDFPMVVTLRHIHNHSTDHREPLKYDTPDHDVQKIFLNYFKKGYTPSKAMDMFVKEMEKELSIYENFTLYDLTVCPDERWVYHYYYRVFRIEYADRDEYTKPNNRTVKRTEVRSSKEEIVNPYIEEILENMSETSEIIFVDSVGNIERISLFPSADSEEKLEVEKNNKEHANLNKNKTENGSKAEVIGQLQLIFDNIIENVQHNDDMLPAAKKFINNSSKLNSEKSLILALSRFGQNSQQADRRKLRHKYVTRKYSRTQNNTLLRWKENLKRRQAIISQNLKKQQNLLAQNCNSIEPKLLPNIEL